MLAFSLFRVLCIVLATFSSAVPLSGTLSEPSLFPRGNSAAPPGALIVSKTPQAGEYSTIQSAIEELQKRDHGNHSIYITAGVYDEAVYINRIKGSLLVYGENKQTGSYLDNQVTITHGNSQKNKPSNDLTATLRVHMHDFKMYHVNVVNSFGQGSQALAISIKGRRQGYYGCIFDGFQDTVLSNDGNHFFGNCLIKGATDMIFGQRGHAFFHRCDISVPAVKSGWIFAPGGNDTAVGALFVLDHSRILTQGDESPTTMYLGRPWGLFARATVQFTYLPAFINPLGWDIWHPGDERTKNAEFSEYQNSGPGSKTDQRAPFSSQLCEPISMQAVLGKTDWIDQSYIP